MKRSSKALGFGGQKTNAVKEFATSKGKVIVEVADVE